MAVGGGIVAVAKSLFRRKRFLFLGLPLLLVVFGGAVFWVASQKEPERPPQRLPEPEPVKLKPHLLNGVMVDPSIHNRRAVAVMVENSLSARPQTGLTAADLVYEAVTEGGITRFMAIYSQEYPEKVGPVRSARSYFLDWLSEFDGFYAHAGGSATALARIREFGIKSYPHSADAYWREPRPGVASEHTLFVNVAKIFQFGVEKRGWPALFDFPTWQFKDEELKSEAQTVTVNFSSPNYQTTWDYMPDGGYYARNLAGSPHRDKISNEQIAVKTLIVQTVERSPNAPSGGRESEWTMQTVGSGAVSVFRDGQRIDGIWRKNSRTERTRFYDAENNEIKLNRGKIWVAILPPTGSVSLTVHEPPVM